VTCAHEAGDPPRRSDFDLRRKSMGTSRLSRRRFLVTTAATTAAVAMPHVRGSYAAGKLTAGFWDHWVPGGNAATDALVAEWSDGEKAEVQTDHITNPAKKTLPPPAAEAQQKTGHDILPIRAWPPADHAHQLEPVDDVMEALIKQNGPVNPLVEYLGKP